MSRKNTLIIITIALVLVVVLGYFGKVYYDSTQPTKLTMEQNLNSQIQKVTQNPLFPKDTLSNQKNEFAYEESPDNGINNQNQPTTSIITPPNQSFKTSPDLDYNKIQQFELKTFPSGTKLIKLPYKNLKNPVQPIFDILIDSPNRDQLFLYKDSKLALLNYNLAGIFEFQYKEQTHYFLTLKENVGNPRFFVTNGTFEFVTELDFGGQIFANDYAIEQGDVSTLKLIGKKVIPAEESYTYQDSTQSLDLVSFLDNLPNYKGGYIESLGED
jgi:hypothetical protein